MKQFLVTGIGSGLGKYLYNGLPECDGLSRTNFHEVRNQAYDTIIHCAFNKENPIQDYKRYLDDNINLVHKVKSIFHNNFVYISSVDVYQENPTTYALFKRFAESILDPDDLILRCPMLFGYTMKPNHATKLAANRGYIGLSKDSIFNYMSMSQLLIFFKNQDHKKYTGVVDFVAEDVVRLEDVKKHFKSTLELGSHVYLNSMSDYKRPIYSLDPSYKTKSFQNLINNF